MSDYTPKQPLEKSESWKLANQIAEHVYSVLAELPEEEKWHSGSDLRAASTDVLFYVAQALGNGAPGGSEYEWGNARKNVAALKTTYRFAGKQKFFELEPEIMVKLDKLVSLIDEELVNAHKQAEKANNDELEHWRKKYNIWKETSA